MGAMNKTPSAHLPVGTEILDEGVRFRVWAPGVQEVEVVVRRGGDPDRELSQKLQKDTDGYFAGAVTAAEAGDQYGFRLGDDPFVYPDPASRFQPNGPHGMSEIVDPSAYEWSDKDWRGLPINGQVIYEMHIGTFTPDGTWNAAAKELQALAELGITTIQMLPVAEFAGEFGWGYDGVDLFAPTHLYGSPDDLRRFIDKAHSLGMAVIHDVVYNHLGPDGNYLERFSPDYFTDRHMNEWGPAVNFDGPNSHGVRDFVLSNVRYWIEEFHFDGFRLDATQSLFDSSPEHIIVAIARVAKQSGGGRNITVIAENEPQRAIIVRPVEEGGYGVDAVWNDDFHHAAMVAVTGKHEAYYSDYLGTPQELLSCMKWGWLFQGQTYFWQGQARGTPAFGLTPLNFVNFIQNHDQVANSLRGERLTTLTDPGTVRAMTAVLLLFPQTPMLFQGQEYGATTPFLYFADHKEGLRDEIFEGRLEHLRQFPSIASVPIEDLPMPHDPHSFETSKLSPSERDRNSHIHRLHKDLITLRKNDPTIRLQGADGIDGSVINERAFLVRYFSSEEEDRLLIVNLGMSFDMRPMGDPLLAPPSDSDWSEMWNSENPAYGGTGTRTVEQGDAWRITSHSAILLRPTAR